MAGRHGTQVENVSAERWWIFQRALPVYGPCARPLDLLQGDPPERWLLEVKAPTGLHQVLGLFNWSGEPCTQRIAPVEWGLNAPEGALYFDFWQQTALGPATELEVTLPPCSCRVLLIRPAGTMPTWVGSDRHVTGAIGLERFAYDEATHTLTGECSGPARSTQRHYVYLPEGLQPLRSAGAAFEAPQYRLLRFTVELGDTGRRVWQVQLTHGRIV